MPLKVDPPVTRESIEAAQLAAAVERAAAGIICDSDGRILFVNGVKRDAIVDCGAGFSRERVRR